MELKLWLYYKTIIRVFTEDKGTCSPWSWLKYDFMGLLGSTLRNSQRKVFFMATPSEKQNVRYSTLTLCSFLGTY